MNRLLVILSEIKCDDECEMLINKKFSYQYRFSAATKN